jgi:hypothetical protein
MVLFSGNVHFQQLAPQIFLVHLVDMRARDHSQLLELSLKELALGAKEF